MSCDDLDSNALTVEQALDKIYAAITPVTETESAPLRRALDRVLSEAIAAPINVPTATNSAMDGYAINSGDLPATGSKALQLIGCAFAGKPYQGQIDKGQCVQIMTGAVMPAGADTVVIQEHVNAVNEHSINIASGDTAPGANVRQAGEDLAIGDAALDKGTRINAADLGVLASLGIGELKVSRKLRVACFSTGDELRSIGEPLDNGAIYDSNRYTLFGMLSQLNVEILDMGVVPDVREALQDAFETAAAKADVLITTGGVSVGEADYVKEILGQIGSINFWKVAIKPGRPLAFGKIKQAYFFGLPGNPVSVMVTFLQFVQPTLRFLMGETQTQAMTLQLPCLSKLKKRPGRVEYQRGIMGKNEQDQMVVRKTGKQGSGILRSMSQANCFIVLPMECGPVEPGTIVEVQPLSL